MINFLTLFFYIFFFGLGTIIGSFLNVVALRLNTGKSIAFSRSSCFHCDEKLQWYELIPILSFLAQQGKCRNCESRISPQYIVVELLTGLVFAGIAAMFATVSPFTIAIDIFPILFYLVLFSLLIIITIYDLRHMIIPDSLSYAFSFLALLHLIYIESGALLHFPGIWALLAGPILALPFALVWLLSGGRWMGLGDAKLALGIGWLLGIIAGLSAVMLAFWIGALISVLLLIHSHASSRKKNRLSLKSEVPFAPFLILGLVLVFFFHFDILGFLLLGW